MLSQYQGMEPEIDQACPVCIRLGLEHRMAHDQYNYAFLAWDRARDTPSTTEYAALRQTEQDAWQALEAIRLEREKHTETCSTKRSDL
jgi:hypothetical protein